MPAGREGGERGEGSEPLRDPPGSLRDPPGALPLPPHLGQAGSGAPRGRFRSAGATEMAPPAAAVGAGRARVRAGGMQGAGEGPKGPGGAGQGRAGRALVVGVAAGTGRAAAGPARGSW